jgi:hypothetical protein
LASWQRPGGPPELPEHRDGIRSSPQQPRCLTCRRACPPRVAEASEATRSLSRSFPAPSHEAHQDRLKWLGPDLTDQFDRVAFHAMWVSSALPLRTTVLVKN